MNRILLISILLSILPISEIRGAIPFALKNNINVINAFFILSFFNILIVPFVFFFLDNLHKHFLKIKIYEKLFNKYIERIQRKFEYKIGISGYIALFFFVLMPLPATGAYTGTLIAWFFKMNRKYSFISISLGVFSAGLIVTLISLGIFKMF